MKYRDALHIWSKANLFIQNQQYHEAIKVFQEAYDQYPDHDWYALYIGDLYAYYLKDHEQAFQVYEKPLLEAKHRMNTSTLSPLRYLLKRVSRQYYEKRHWEKAEIYYEWFMSFQPSNFHDQEFIRYAEALRMQGKIAKSMEILSLGIRYSLSRKLRETWNKYAPNPVEILPYPAILNGFKRIPVQTEIIMPGAAIPEIVDYYTRDIRQKGDILTIASCVVAVAERRMYSVENIRASALAKLLSRFVHDDRFPFGGNAPLCNPLSMQAALQECGILRILFAAVIGGIISKLIRGSGMFYRMAGPQAALIDDMPGAIPPFDYYVVLGPKDANATSREISKITQHDAAVIDANDLQIAWAVGCSDFSKRKVIETAMQDNPAGNGDQRTPVIILRPAVDNT